LANMIPTTSSTSSCFQIISKDESHFWHFRFGQLNYNGLKTLFSTKMINGLPLLMIS